MPKATPQKKAHGSALGFEAQPGAAADKLRGLMDASEYNGARPEGLGRVYEYFLGKFASVEGKGGGEFYTPQCVVQVLVAMLEPYKGRVFETLQSADMSCRNRRIHRRSITSVRGKRRPCARTSGARFVQSDKFVEEHVGRVGDIAVLVTFRCAFGLGQQTQAHRGALQRNSVSAVKAISLRIEHYRRLLELLSKNAANEVVREIAGMALEGARPKKPTKRKPIAGLDGQAPEAFT